MSMENRGFKRSNAETESRYSKDKLDIGVRYARSLVEKGYLSSAEAEAIESAQGRLNKGISLDTDNDLLARWADKADWAQAREQSTANQRRNFIQELGPDTLEEIEGYSSGIESSMKAHLFGARHENHADVDRVRALWREFGERLVDCLQSTNLRDPKRVEEALGLANALLQPRPSQQDKDIVRDSIEALKRQYGI